MPEHKIGTREEWQAARDELAKLEAEQAERDEEIKEKRRDFAPVEDEYVFETQEGKKTLAELFEGRSQLLAYNVMYGPDYSVGACPEGTRASRTSFDGARVHLGHKDVTLICFYARRSIGSPHAKERMGWDFPLRVDLRDRLPLGLRLR